MSQDLFKIHDVDLGSLAAAGSVSGSDLLVINQGGVQKSATVAQVASGESAVTAVTGTSPIVSSGGATPAISLAASATVSGAGGAESLVVGSNVVKRGTKLLVPVDGSAPIAVAFGSAFATAVDNIQLTVRSHTSVTLKIIAVYPVGAAITTAGFDIEGFGGDASSTASVDWEVWGH